MADKHFLKCSKLLVIMETQIKITLRFILPSVRMAKIVEMTANVSIDMRKREHLLTVGGSKVIQPL